MLLFGITGGIGSGKSAVCKFLKKKKVPIIEADPVAKDLTNSLSEIREGLIQEFGENVYRNGRLNKKKLSELVFSSTATRERVNQIIHPHVFQWVRKEAVRLQEQEQQELVGVEAALIYESSMEQMLDKVVVVSAPLQKRVKWLQKRNHFSQTEIQKRIDSQMPLSEKVNRADYIIDNEGTLIKLSKKVDALYDWLCLQLANK